MADKRGRAASDSSIGLEQRGPEQSETDEWGNLWVIIPAGLLLVLLVTLSAFLLVAFRSRTISDDQGLCVLCVLHLFILTNCMRFNFKVRTKVSEACFNWDELCTHISYRL